jgi:hypothetical protein
MAIDYWLLCSDDLFQIYCNIKVDQAALRPVSSVANM